MCETRAKGRPREFDEDAALTAIMRTFWFKGFNGASMSDLTAASGLKKGSLYAAFGDKRAMYHKALALYDGTRIEGAVQALTSPGAPLKKIDRFLQAAVDATPTRDAPSGCFICNASIDQAGLDKGAERIVQASLARLEDALAEAARELGVGAPAQAARHLVSVYFGLRVLAKASAPAATLVDAKRAAMKTLPAA